MKITSQNNTTNFKAIKLTLPESKKAANLVRNYRNTGDIKAKTQIVDIFTPHIEKEAKEKAEENNNLSMKDYAQNLHLKLLEKIETVNLKYHPVPYIVDRLNEYKSGKDDFFVLAENKSIEELTPEEEYIISDKGQPSLKEKMHTVVSTFIEGKRNKAILNDYIDRYSTKELGQKYSLTPNRCQQIIDKYSRILHYKEKRVESSWPNGIFVYKEFNTGRIGSFLEDSY